MTDFSFELTPGLRQINLVFALIGPDYNFIYTAVAVDKNEANLVIKINTDTIPVHGISATNAIIYDLDIVRYSYNRFLEGLD